MPLPVGITSHAFCSDPLADTVASPLVTVELIVTAVPTLDSLVTVVFAVLLPVAPSAVLTVTLIPTVSPGITCRLSADDGMNRPSLPSVFDSVRLENSPLVLSTVIVEPPRTLLVVQLTYRPSGAHTTLAVSTVGCFTCETVNP